MSDLIKRFKTIQISKLKSVGIQSLYDLVTYLPFRYFKVKPWYKFNFLDDSDTRYLFEGTLSKIDVKKNNGRQFLILHFETEDTEKYNFYLFQVSSFTIKTLNLKQKYQLLLSRKGSFWSIEKFVEMKLGEELVDDFILGKAKIGEYLGVVYPKLGYFNSALLQSYFNKLDAMDFILNLEGLVPKNNALIPTLIDLSKVHRPKNPTEFQQTLKDWKGLRLFLKIAIHKYVTLTKEITYSQPSEINWNFLQDLTNSLPYSLSSSQAKTVKEILKDL